jgi:Putative zinc-finger
VRLTCKEASRLLSLGLDRRLTLAQRAALRLHLALCDACTKVKAQFDFLRRALTSYSGSTEDRNEPPNRDI